MYREYLTLKINRYADTVMMGDNPLMVWTRETSIRDIASEERIWPPIMNPVMGSVVMITSRVGFLMPFLRAGILLLKAGNTDDK